MEEEKTVMEEEEKEERSMREEREKDDVVELHAAGDGPDVFRETSPADTHCK